MPLDATAYKQLIVDEVGDSAAGAVATRIDTLWTANDDKAAASSLRLQYLYTKRAAIDVLMGTVREQVTEAQAGAQILLSDKLKALAVMRGEVTDDIVQELAGVATAAQRAGQPAGGQLATTQLRRPPDGWQGLDADDALMRGDVYRRPWRP